MQNNSVISILFGICKIISVPIGFTLITQICILGMFLMIREIVIIYFKILCFSG